MFDNVFVNPESYKSFVETGTWPDKTVLVLEGPHGPGRRLDQPERQLPGHRDHGHRSPRQGRSPLPREWAFFIFGDDKTAKIVPTNMECYTCHAQHAAVDTTFVQFYPTLLPIAQSKGTGARRTRKRAPPAEVARMCRDPLPAARWQRGAGRRFDTPHIFWHASRKIFASMNLPRGSLTNPAKCGKTMD